jgi:hypothetical protein
VVIRVEVDVFQVVVFAARANAFLGIGSARVLAGNRTGPFAHVGLFLAQKNAQTGSYPRW